MIGEAEHGSFGIAVIDPDPRARGHLAMQFEGGTAVATYADVAALLEQPPSGPIVAVIGPGLADGPGLAEIAAMVRSRPDIQAILVADELTTGLLQQALRSGVRDVVSAAEPQALHESIHHLREALTQHPEVPPAAGTASGAEPGRVITVSSMKGGSGKTVVATNLAILLAQESPGPVVLVDADLQFGDVAVMLRLNVSLTIADSLAAGRDLDAQFLQSLLIRHEASGLFVLASPLEPSLADRIFPEDLLRVLGVLRSFCSYVVVDTPAVFNDVVVSLLEASDHIVLVTGMEIPTIKNTRLGLQTMRQLGMPDSKVTLLVNRANSKVQINVEEVERTLGLKAGVQLPSDIAVPQGINRGVPVVIGARRSDVTRSIEALADLVAAATGGEPAHRAPRGRFGRA